MEYQEYPKYIRESRTPGAEADVIVENAVDEKAVHDGTAIISVVLLAAVGNTRKVTGIKPVSKKKEPK